MEEVKIGHVDVKSVMTKSSLPVGGYSVNPYVGCTHACKYCYASFMKRFTGHTEEWGTFLDVKHWPEIRNPQRYAGQRVVIGSVTDGYNPQRTSDMASFSKWNAKQDPRTELHDVLGLTGAEISINNLPAGAGVPFVHSHKKNEEIYIILSGKGSAVLDGEKVDFAAGDVIRIAPAVKRQFSAAVDSAVSYACIQVRENSLEEYTAGDAVIG